MSVPVNSLPIAAAVPSRAGSASGARSSGQGFDSAMQDALQPGSAYKPSKHDAAASAGGRALAGGATGQAGPAVAQTGTGTTQPGAGEPATSGASVTLGDAKTPDETAASVQSIGVPATWPLVGGQALLAGDVSIGTPATGEAAGTPTAAVPTDAGTGSPTAGTSSTNSALGWAAPVVAPAGSAGAAAGTATSASAAAPQAGVRAAAAPAAGLVDGQNAEAQGPGAPAAASTAPTALAGTTAPAVTATGSPAATAAAATDAQGTAAATAPAAASMPAAGEATQNQSAASPVQAGPTQPPAQAAAATQLSTGVVLPGQTMPAAAAQGGSAATAGTTTATVAAMASSNGARGEAEQLPANGQIPVAAQPAPVSQPAATTPTSAPAPVPPHQQLPFTAQVARPLFTLAQAKPGEHVMTISVTPDNLGPVTVRAHVTGEGVRVELFAPNEAGRDALRAIMTDLKRDLASTGMNANLDLSNQNRPNDARPGMQFGPDGQPSGGSQGQDGSPGTATATDITDPSALRRPYGISTSLDVLA
ncbi:flagellar hook-length control protein FliK [Arthrobacter sp.]|uniref:flagellar hook-length control protein FliK n=1 Tax=Arthrobacter sp. TaxID=1667 RepID=UPI0033997789